MASSGQLFCSEVQFRLQSTKQYCIFIFFLTLGIVLCDFFCHHSWARWPTKWRTLKRALWWEIAVTAFANTPNVLLVFCYFLLSSKPPLALTLNAFFAFKALRQLIGFTWMLWVWTPEMTLSRLLSSCSTRHSLIPLLWHVYFVSLWTAAVGALHSSIKSVIVGASACLLYQQGLYYPVSRRRIGRPFSDAYVLYRFNGVRIAPITAIYPFFSLTEFFFVQGPNGRRGLWGRRRPGPAWRRHQDYLWSGNYSDPCSLLRGIPLTSFDISWTIYLKNLKQQLKSSPAGAFSEAIQIALSVCVSYDYFDQFYCLLNNGWSQVRKQWTGFQKDLTYRALMQSVWVKEWQPWSSIPFLIQSNNNNNNLMLLSYL